MTDYGSRHYLMYSIVVVLYLLAGVYGAESTVTEDDFYKIDENDRILIENMKNVMPVRPTMPAGLKMERESMKDNIKQSLDDTTPVDSYVSTDYNYTYRPHHGPGLLGVIVILWRLIKHCRSNSETTEGEETADDESKLVV